MLGSIITALKLKVIIAISVCVVSVPLLVSVVSVAQDTGSTPAPEATAEATAEATVSTTPAPEATASVTPAPEATAEVTVEAGSGIIIVIEGPVEAINVNIITIYNINIRVPENDPALTVIKIGDVLRIQGELTGDDDHQGDEDGDIVINLIAINIIFINIDVVVVDGQVWRDPGNCDNPPPDWAPAHGWRRRCEGGNNGGGGGGGVTIIITGGGEGSGGGMGMGRKK